MSDHRNLGNRFKSWFQGKPDAGRPPSSQREEGNNPQLTPEGYGLSMKAIRQHANYAHIFEQSISKIVEVGIDPERLQALLVIIPTLFVRPHEADDAISFIRAIEYRHIGYQNDSRNSYLHSSASGLRDKVREEIGYENAAKIIRTLLPQEVWEQRVLPRINNQDIPSLID